jgi:ribosomal protein S18 acetylase RimI-like enzyme
MAVLELQPFSAEHIEAAAELLAERHARHCAAEPLLPADIDFRTEVAALWEKEGASGAVGLRDGRVVGYVLATRLADDVWGPNAWVELAGHAVELAEDVRDLYGFAAASWADERRTGHYVYVPASDAELVDAWFRVGFGAQHAFGIRELADDPAPELPHITARAAEERDVEAMVAIAPELSRHQALAPVFAKLREESAEEIRAEVREDLGNRRIGSLVAELDGRVVGNFVVVPIELSTAHSGLARPPGVAHLGFAATLPEARGWGAGLALTAASFAWAREQGYDVMVTDWRVTNLLSSRFWPRRGFRETFLRLFRAISSPE